MNYKAQEKLVRDTIKRFPKFREQLRKYVKYFNTEGDLRYYYIRLKGVQISDKVLLDLKEEF